MWIQARDAFSNLEVLSTQISRLFFYGDSHPDKLGNLDDQEQQDLQANQCFHCWLQELVSD